MNTCMKLSESLPEPQAEALNWPSAIQATLLPPAESTSTPELSASIDDCNHISVRTRFHTVSTAILRQHGRVMFEEEQICRLLAAI
jgi:hypothetical protein